MLCKSCGDDKPAAAFYRRSGGIGYMSYCRACMTARNRRTPQHNPTETDVLERLWQAGIATDHGRYTRFASCDLVALGCVRIEVKRATRRETGRSISWLAGCTPQQVRRGLIADVVIIVCDTVDYVFPVDTPALYRDGRLKTAIGFTEGNTRPAARGASLLLCADVAAAQFAYQRIWDAYAAALATRQPDIW